MKKLSKIYSDNILKKFLLLQPIVDILTSLMMRYFDMSITIGVIFRTIFLIYALIYLIFINKQYRKIKYIYFSIFAVYFIGFFVINCNNSFWFSELTSFIKYIYYPVILMFLIQLINDNEIFNTLFKTCIVINLLMLFSQIIGGTIDSYGSGKIGNSGWFFSANELSVILSMLFPIIFYKFIKKTNFINIINLSIMLITMSIIGTKTTYLSIFITLFSYIIYLIIIHLILKNKIVSKIRKTIIVLTIFILLTPIMPIYKNMSFHLDLLNQNLDYSDLENDKEDITNLMLYGREEYLKEARGDMNKSGVENWLFGLGKIVKKNDSKFKYYEVEMDFHNLFYCYGIFGIIVFLIPQIFVFIVMFKNIIKNGIKKIDDKLFLLGISILVAYLISCLAGHTVLAVSPATYLSYIVAVTYSLIIKQNIEKKKKVMFISSVGGHLTQLLEFKKIFNDYDYVLITEKTDVTQSMKNKYNISFLPYGSRNQKYSYPFILILNCIKSFCYLIKYDPEVIITTGANTAAAMCCLGKIFGKKVIYIESFAKRTSPTVTGKGIYKLHAYTVFVVQWESMLEYYPNAVYWGGIY